jgi:hypothetical protein
MNQPGDGGAPPPYGEQPNQPPYGQQPNQPFQPYPPAPQYQQPYGQQPYGQQPYGAPPPYGPPGGPYGYPQPTGTNGLAIASLILAFLCSIAGLICGIIALNQINQSRQEGRGLAIAGIIVSCVGIVGGIIYVAAYR